MKKKKGFTLIELVASIGLLALCLSGITAAFLASSRIWRTENIKIDSVTNNQTIAQSIKFQGKTWLDGIYENTTIFPHVGNLAVGEKVYIFMYFDNYDDIKEDIKQIGNGAKGTTPDSDKIKSLGSETTDLFASCKGGNSANKTFGASICIENLKGANYYTVYKVSTNVWKLKENGQYASRSTSYIGR